MGETGPVFRPALGASSMGRLHFEKVPETAVALLFVAAGQTARLGHPTHTKGNPRTSSHLIPPHPFATIHL